MIQEVNTWVQSCLCIGLESSPLMMMSFCLRIGVLVVVMIMIFVGAALAHRGVVVLKDRANSIVWEQCLIEHQDQLLTCPMWSARGAWPSAASWWCFQWRRGGRRQLQVYHLCHKPTHKLKSEFNASLTSPPSSVHRGHPGSGGGRIR